MTAEQLLPYLWGGLGAIVTGIVWLLVWQRHVEHQMTTIRERIRDNDEVADTVHKNEQRIAVLETTVNGLDFGEHVSNLHRRVDDIASTTATSANEIHEQRGQLTQINANVKLILDNMINPDKYK